jgi:hypothetical protein
MISYWESGRIHFDGFQYKKEEEEEEEDEFLYSWREWNDIINISSRDSEEKLLRKFYPAPNTFSQLFALPALAANSLPCC